MLLASASARAQALDAASDTASKAKPSFDIRIEAPDEARDLLERHLELRRYREVPDLDAGELLRLADAARENARELLGTLGYFSPTIAVQVQPGPVVRIAAEPGPVTTVRSFRLRFTGAVSGTDEDQVLRRELRAAWSLRDGDRFTQSGWDDAKSAAVRQLGARKFPLARLVDSLADIDPDANAAELSATLDSGPAFRLGALQIEGAQRYGLTLPSRLLRLRPGSDYDQAELLEAQQRLISSGYYASAFVSIDTEGDPTAAPVRVQLREAPPQKLVLGVGVSTDAGPRLSVEHTHRALPWLDGWQAVTSLSLDRLTQTGALTLTAPPDERLWRWVASGQVQQQASAGVDVASQRLRLGRTQDGERIDRSYFLQYDRARTTGPGTDETAESLTANYAWTMRRFDNALSPRDGWGLGVELGGGSTFGSRQDPFARVLARWLALWPLAYNERTGLPLAHAGRIATRVEAGAVLARDAAQLPASQLFATGGDTTVRGYGLRAIGARQTNGVIEPGRYLAVGSVEWQRPFIINGKPSDFEGAVFLDAGAVADKPGELRAQVGVGAGVRWRSPVGPLQVDLAWGVQSRQLRLHLNVGFTF